MKKTRPWTFFVALMLVYLFYLPSAYCRQVDTKWGSLFFDKKPNHVIVLVNGDKRITIFPRLSSGQRIRVEQSNILGRASVDLLKTSKSVKVYAWIGSPTISFLSREPCEARNSPVILVGDISESIEKEVFAKYIDFKTCDPFLKDKVFVDKLRDAIAKNLSLNDSNSSPLEKCLNNPEARKEFQKIKGMEANVQVLAAQSGEFWGKSFEGKKPNFKIDCNPESSQPAQSKWSVNGELSISVNPNAYIPSEYLKKDLNLTQGISHEFSHAIIYQYKPQDNETIIQTVDEICDTLHNNDFKGVTTGLALSENSANAQSSATEEIRQRVVENTNPNSIEIPADSVIADLSNSDNNVVAKAATNVANTLSNTLSYFTNTVIPNSLSKSRGNVNTDSGPQKNLGFSNSTQPREASAKVEAWSEKDIQENDPYTFNPKQITALSKAANANSVASKDSNQSKAVEQPKLMPFTATTLNTSELSGFAGGLQNLDSSIDAYQKAQTPTQKKAVANVVLQELLARKEINGLTASKIRAILPQIDGDLRSSNIRVEKANSNVIFGYKQSAPKPLLSVVDDGNSFKWKSNQ